MTVRDLFRRTQVRSAVAFTLLITVSVSALFAMLIVRLADGLEDGVRARILNTRDALLAIDRRYGFDELVSVVIDEAESVREADSIFAVLDGKGAIVAGNIRSERPFEGWRVLERSHLPDIANDRAGHDRFFAVWTPVSKGMLLIGRSDREVQQARLILMRSLGWGILATAILGVGSGIYLARGAQRRIDDIANTLSAVSAGELARRVPIKLPHHDLDEVGERINAMLTQLERLVQNANQSSTDIAHDLKRPMTRLRQQLESASEIDSASPAIKGILEEAIAEVDSIVSTFEALLNIGQLEAGDRRARFIDIDLSKVLDDVAEAYAPVIEDSGFKLAWNTAQSPSSIVRGDHELLVQLMANLIENALQHCPEGTTIQLGLTNTSRGSVAHVADNGPGIPASEHENVFRRFYRLERERSSPGHGLGLSLVRAIADLHGASVALADNHPGLKVSVAFPSRS
ncbi:HAMP domain-containing sensor histidine kinase [Hyphomicrobium sp.]|uniref:sensor histidine kinase n=1 Tax=Hyphomicrobium sp. TaxID=82 RepID=UPI0025B9124A|nr:HAMP domain-containing sensor histidine kinase [Hyphomicrobium sp.]MCC7251449.1 HAMP domain-containing histidine kinase [Hyphomicrobium sp.]